MTSLTVLERNMQDGAKVMPYQDSIRPEALTDTHFPPQNESSEMKFEILIPIILFSAFYTILIIFFPRRTLAKMSDSKVMKMTGR